MFSDAHYTNVEFDHTTWSARLQSQVQGVTNTLQFWDDSAVRPWSQDDPFNFDKNDFSLLPIDPAADSHMSCAVVAQGMSPVWEWTIDPSRLSLPSGEWLTINVQFITARDDGFSLAFDTNGAWSFEVDPNEILTITRKVVGHYTINGLVAYGAATVTGKIRRILTGKRLRVTLRSKWLASTGSGTGLEVALLLNLRILKGWLVPTPNTWYPAVSTKMLEVPRPARGSHEEAESPCESVDGDWSDLGVSS